MANYKRLRDELRGDRETIRPVDIARGLGISKVYAWQLENGKREAIDSKAARLMERTYGKPEGWMDTDFDQWPFPDIGLLATVEKLDRDKRLELQGALKKFLLDETGSVPESGKLSGYQRSANS